MHDIRQIRENGAGFDLAMKRRGHEPVASEILDIDRSRRDGISELQALQQRRNTLSRKIGAVRREGGDAECLTSEVTGIRDRIRELEASGREFDARLETMLEALPNRLDDDVPDGADEHDNVEVRRIGEQPTFDFQPRDHVALGEASGLMSFTTAARMSGARFVVLHQALARLHRALANFMLDHQTQEFGYAEVAPPLLVRDQALYGTGQLPKFADQQFLTTEGHWLIPTSEVPLTNLVAESILDADELPLRYTAWTPCFRSEAGAAGRDTRGMIRMHQFDKVEMVSIVHPEHSMAEHERMTACAESILKRLDLPFRTVVLCSGDTGFSARKTYDIEVWLPGQEDGSGRYREISSCSNCGDFQARRMRARFRAGAGGSTDFVHTLNGSGLAVGRTLIAIMENGQQPDGSIELPAALHPYMGGVEYIDTGHADRHVG